MDSLTTNVSVPFLKYEEMANKAKRYDILHSLIKIEIDNGNDYPVRDELVLSLLNLYEYAAKQKKQVI